MKLSVQGKLKLAARLAFVASMSTMAASAYAQETTTTTESSTEEGVQLDAITVTGSRIKQPALTSVSPITVVTAEAIEYQGTTRIEDMLNSMPQVFAGQGANVSNGATGTATVDLRGLGAARTLVLIDGKRMLPGDPASPEADLNFIPASLIEGIDISTGGASAVYGSDAVAGVVNFKMKRDFEGVSIDVQRSGYWHDNDNQEMQDINADRSFGAPDGKSFDGQGWDITTALGINTDDGKGNATVYAIYRQIDSLSQDARDYSNCALGYDFASGDYYHSNYACSGSSTSYPGRFINLLNGSSVTIDQNAAGDATFRPYSGATDAFNFNPYNYFQRNDERYGMGAFAHYEVNSHFDAYTDLMFMSDRTNAVIAPSGAFLGNLVYDIPCDGSNPLISGEQLAAVCASSAGTVPVLVGRRNVEGGGRDDDLTHQSYRMVLGGRGAIVDGWDYDAYVQFGQSTLSEIYRNDFSVARLGRALTVVDDGSGNAVCASVLDGSDPNCVPWNIWSLGGVDSASLDYLQTPGFLSGHTEQQIVSASVSGSLGQYGVTSPFAVDGVGVAIGTEYRHEATVYETDVAFATGDLAGQGGATLGNAGALQVKELFGEIKVPLVQDKPFVKDLGIELGYRYTDHSLVEDSIDTYKIGANFSPISDLTFRGGYNRAVRAPSILEVAQPTQVALDGNSDPCAGTTPSASAAECANDPYFAANPGAYGSIIENSAAQYNGLYGTSPGLKPEEADTYTAGVVITPRMVKGLSVTVDYFDIEVDGLISGIGADTILNLCYSQGLYCNLIHRDSNGSLWLSSNGYVIDQTTNIGSLATSGVDFTTNYKTSFAKLGLPDVGTLTVDLVGTYLSSYDIVSGPGSPTQECAGKYGYACGTPNPEWRGKLRTTWGTPWMDSKLSVQWRYFSSVYADESTASVGNRQDYELGSQSYIDLYGSVMVKTVTFELGMNNVFDREPPINGLGLGNGNTFSQVYDALGTYVFGGIRAEF